MSITDLDSSLRCGRPFRAERTREAEWELGRTRAPGVRKNGKKWEGEGNDCYAAVLQTAPQGQFAFQGNFSHPDCAAAQLTSCGPD